MTPKIFIWTGIFILTLMGASVSDKELTIILNDGLFSGLPKSASNIRAEIVNGKTIRHGYLYFDAPADQIKEWIEKSNLQATSKEEIFEKNISPDTRQRPTWFQDLEKEGWAGKLYFSQRHEDKFLNYIHFDVYKNRIVFEYQRVR